MRDIVTIAPKDLRNIIAKQELYDYEIISVLPGNEVVIQSLYPWKDVCFRAGFKYVIPKPKMKHACTTKER